MFATPAYAQAAGAAAAGSPLTEILQGPAPLLVLMLVAGYFLLFRPQQQRVKKHQELITSVKRGDTVVLTNGVIGKVVRVEDAEIGVEIATGVTVKVIKAMIHDVRVKGSLAPANDAKS
jgi:preprotein translocase subunit YajC